MAALVAHCQAPALATAGIDICAAARLTAALLHNLMARHV